MSFVATAIGTQAVTGLLGANAQAGATSDAAKSQQAQAAWLFGKQSELNQPYMYAGNAALNPLMALYGINANLQTGPGGTYTGAGTATPDQQQAAMNLFYQSPEYTLQKTALDQALQRQASAAGIQYSPSTALGQAEIAGRVFGDWRNNLAGLAQMGPNAANQQGSNLQNFGSNVMNATGQIGQAKANMYGAFGQTAMDALGQLGQYGAYRNQMGQYNQMLANAQNPVGMTTVSPEAFNYGMQVPGGINF